jgi:hypothetical protein
LAENGSYNNNNNNGGYKRGPYKPLEKSRIKSEIYNRILQGYPYSEIMEYLKMPERTFYTYLADIRREEKDFLKDTISKEEMRWQTQLSHDRLEANLNRIHKWLDDPNFKESKIAALHLASEINAAIMRLYVYGPSYFNRYLSSSNNNKSSNQKEEEEEEERREAVTAKDSFGFD